MIELLLKNIGRFFIYSLIQILLCNNARITSLDFTPFVYIAFLLTLPFETPNWLLLIVAFVQGMFIDMFSYSLGLHTASCVCIAYFRPLILAKLVNKNDYFVDSSPTLKQYGYEWFFKYTTLMVLIHHTLFFMLDVFSFANFHLTLLRIIGSAILSLIVIFFVQFFSK